MSDVEDDFFGLADGQVLSSDGESESGEPRDASGRSTSASSPKKRDGEGTPKATRKGTAAKKTKKRKGSDDEDSEGEESDAPGSPNSLNSAPMDESDSENEAPAKPSASGPARPYNNDEDDDAKYPVDGLFASQREKQQIMGMTMLEREQILADRRDEADKRRQNRLIRQLVSNQESEEKMQKKRKASSAELEDDEEARKSTRLRTKTGGGASSRFDDLKRARAAKSDRARGEEERRRGRNGDDRRPTSRHSNFSDRDLYGYDDRPKAPTRSRSPEPNYANEPATFRDFDNARMNRSYLSKFCFYPGFAESIIGCYCRVNVGQQSDGQPNYRMALLKDINKGKPYALPSSQSTKVQIVTDMYVVLSHGKSVREWPFIVISDSRFTEAEFNRYKQQCLHDGISLPKRQTILDKISDMAALFKKDLSQTELQEKLNRQNALKRRYMPENKDQLRGFLEVARAAGDEDTVAELQERLDGTDAPRLAFRTSLSMQKQKDDQQQQKLMELNMRNRRANIEDVRTAQIREKMQIRKQQEALERGENVQVDMSRRLKTVAKFIHDVNADDGGLKAGKNGAGGAGGKDGGGGKKGDAGEGNDAMEKLRRRQMEEAGRKGVPTISRPITDDDVIGALDLDIDIDI